MGINIKEVVKKSGSNSVAVLQRLFKRPLTMEEISFVESMRKRNDSYRSRIRGTGVT